MKGACTNRRRRKDVKLVRLRAVVKGRPWPCGCVLSRLRFQSVCENQTWHCMQKSLVGGHFKVFGKGLFLGFFRYFNIEILQLFQILYSPAVPFGPFKIYKKNTCFSFLDTHVVNSQSCHPDSIF